MVFNKQQKSKIQSKVTIVLALVFICFCTIYITETRQLVGLSFSSTSKGNDDDNTIIFQEQGVTTTQNKFDDEEFLRNIVLDGLSKEDAEWKLQLYQRLNVIRQKCGSLCRLDSPTLYEPYQIKIENWPYWDMIQISDWYNDNQQQCKAFIGMEENDASDGTFPKSIPNELLQYYNMNGHVNIGHHRANGLVWEYSYLGTKRITWNMSYIQDSIRLVGKNRMKGSYGIGVANNIKRYLMSGPISMKGLRALVIGSETPWIEVILLYLGANEVTTLEYSTIISEYPTLKTITPNEFRKQYNDGTLEPYDIIISHSSLEHSGLGRYRDALNPWGDLIAVARAWCITKPGGYMLLGIPTGIDAIEYNAHRIYGIYRWPLITTNWIPTQSTIITLNGTELSRDKKKSVGGGGHLYWFQKPMKEIVVTEQQ